MTDLVTPLHAFTTDEQHQHQHQQQQQQQQQHVETQRQSQTISPLHSDVVQSPPASISSRRTSQSGLNEAQAKEAAKTIPFRFAGDDQMHQSLNGPDSLDFPQSFLYNSNPNTNGTICSAAEETILAPLNVPINHDQIKEEDGEKMEGDQENRAQTKSGRDDDGRKLSGHLVPNSARLHLASNIHAAISTPRTAASLKPLSSASIWPEKGSLASRPIPSARADETADTGVTRTAATAADDESSDSDEDGEDHGKLVGTGAAGADLLVDREDDPHTYHSTALATFNVFSLHSYFLLTYELFDFVVKLLTLKTILDPGSRFKMCWDYIIIAMVLYNAFIIPYYIAFEPAIATTLLPADIFTTCTMALDIFVTFRTGFIDYSGHPCYDAHRIARRYWKRGVILDVIGTFPMDAFGQLVTEGSGVERLRYTNCLKVMGLLRLLRLMYNDRLAAFNSPTARITKLIFAFFWLAHLFASIFFFVGVVNPSPNTWVLVQHLDTQSAASQYIASLYWALTTMVTVGYGDIVPVNVYEQAVVIPILLLSALIYATIFGNMAYAIETITSTIRRYQSKIDSVKEFIKVYELPPDLQKKLFDYTNAMWNQNKGFETNEMLAHLPISVKAEVMSHINHSLIMRVPLFKQCSDRFLEAIILRLSSQVCLAGDFIFKEGDKSREMYFVRTGSVEIIMEDEASGIDEVINTIHSFSESPFFGEISLLLGETRTASAKAVSKCILSSLSQQDFFDVMSLFPDEENSLRETAAMRLQADIDREKMKKKKVSTKASFFNRMASVRILHDKNITGTQLKSRPETEDSEKEADDEEDGPDKQKEEPKAGALKGFKLNGSASAAPVSKSESRLTALAGSTVGTADSVEPTKENKLRTGRKSDLSVSASRMNRLVRRGSEKRINGELTEKSVVETGNEQETGIGKEPLENPLEEEEEENQPDPPNLVKQPEKSTIELIPIPSTAQSSTPPIISSAFSNEFPAACTSPLNEAETTSSSPVHHSVPSNPPILLVDFSTSSRHLLPVISPTKRGSRPTSRQSNVKENIAILNSNSSLLHLNQLNGISNIVNNDNSAVNGSPSRGNSAAANQRPSTAAGLISARSQAIDHLYHPHQSSPLNQSSGNRFSLPLPLHFPASALPQPPPHDSNSSSSTTAQLLRMTPITGTGTTTAAANSPRRIMDLDELRKKRDERTHSNSNPHQSIHSDSGTVYLPLISALEEKIMKMESSMMTMAAQIQSLLLLQQTQIPRLPSPASIPPSSTQMHSLERTGLD